MLEKLLKSLDQSSQLHGKISRFEPEPPAPLSAKTKHNGSTRSSRKPSAQYLPIIGEPGSKFGQHKKRVIDRVENLLKNLDKLQRELHRAKSSRPQPRDEFESRRSITSTGVDSKTRLAKQHLKGTSKKVLDDHKVLEKQDLLMTQLSICQDQIEKEIRKLTLPKRGDSASPEKVSFRRLACLNCSTTGKHNHSNCDSDRDQRENSLNSLLEEEGLKNNEICNEIRHHIKKQVGILKAEDLKLIGDDTTLIRMINFFNEYKKRYEEWRRRQEKKERQMITRHTENKDEEESRREKNLKAKKLKPYYYPSLEEENSEDERRKQAQANQSREHSRESSKHKDPQVIKDRSLKGNDRFYEPEVPENVLYVEDASVLGEPSIAGSKYYLTEGERSVSGKKKVTLNLKIPKSKLQNLKNIRALIRTREPTSNSIVTKEKAFNLDYVAETVSTGGDKMNKKYHFRNNGESSVKNSIHDKSTELTSNFPSISPDPKSRNPIHIEKMEFGRRSDNGPLVDLKSSLV